MASTFSDLKIQLMATGENSGTWGDVTNVNLGTAIEEAITGSASVAFSSADVTLPFINTNETQAARNLRLNLTGTSGGARNLIVPAIEKVYIINNGLADTVTVKNAAGTGIAVPTGKTMYVYNNGTNVVDAITHLTSLTTGVLTSTSTTVLNGTTIPASKTLVDTDSTQTLTNKGINLANNTLTATSAQIAAAVSDETGTGALVFANSPTLVTPALGTPASGVVTNLTGTASININGTVGASTPSTVASTNLSYTGTLTGGTGVINIGSGQVVKDANGNVGIGTSTPQGKFDVVGSVANTLATFSTADASTMVLSNTDGAAFGRNSKILFRIGALNLSGIASVFTGFNGAGDISGALAFGTQANAAGGIVERARIDSSGNVGIGTSSPASSGLTIGNQFGGVNLAGGGGSYAQFGGVFGIYPRAGVGLGLGSAVAISFEVNGGTEAARIDASGNLLVGTTGGSARANIRGSVSNSSLFALDVTNSSGTPLFSVRNDGAISTGLAAASPFNLTIGTAANAVFNSDGFLYRSTSSERYKREIKTATWGLSDVNKLRPVTYKGVSKADGEIVYGGLIAEEVDQVGFKEFVAYDDQGRPDALHYGNMVSLAFKAIQELSAKVDTLQAELNTLKGN